jgi:glyceraldehyde-3-phosphate dehydrogenase/erythrose-4-phosphate dehydrogenase
MKEKRKKSGDGVATREMHADQREQQEIDMRKKGTWKAKATIRSIIQTPTKAMTDLKLVQRGVLDLLLDLSSFISAIEKCG